MNKLKYNWELYKNQQPNSKKVNTPKDISIPFEENFKIYLRIKPQPHNNHRNQSIKIIDDRQVQIVPPCFSTEGQRIFQYEQVFGQGATNQQVFERTMQEPIANVLSGYNSTVFIYGMTGAGKTYTMFNSINSQDQTARESEGIVGLAITKLFQEIRQDEHSSFQVFLSFYEIYNENIRDLLCDLSQQQQLNIMEDPVKGIMINELTQLCVEDDCKARRMIGQCLAKRSINSTKNNEYSSRSHAILQFIVKKYISQPNSNEIAMHESKLFLIDLAGNEKAGQNESKRFVEGININKSLLTLGKCINILSQQKKPAFIPYRDSKLTRILKDSLGGNSKTVMIACISSEAKFYEETLNTLKYSTKASKIKNKGRGASIKLISKKQMPRILITKQENNTLQDQEQKIDQLIKMLQILLEQKVRVQIMKEQLQACYEQNKNQMLHDKDNKGCQANMKEISELLPQLNIKLSKVDKKIQQSVKSFTEEQKSSENVRRKEIQTYKAKVKEQSKDIERMKTLISQQKQTIQELAQNNTIESTNLAHSLSQTLNTSDQPIHKISTPTISQKIDNNNFILIHQSNTKNDNPKKITNIEIFTSKNSQNKENIFFNNNKGLKRSKTPQSISTSKLLSHSKQDLQRSKASQKRAVNKPTINISMDNIKIKPPNIRLDLKEDAQNTKDQKDIFILRLKQMDKNLNKFSGEQLKGMVRQYESNSYDLSKMETSMINKLKFVAKTSDRSIKKERSFK